MGNFAIIVPEDGINYIPNPSFEVGTTANWSGISSGSLAMAFRLGAIEPQYSGLYGCQLTASGAGSGMQYTAPPAVYSDFISGTYATVSCYVTHIGSGSPTVTLTLNANDGTAKSNSANTTTAGRLVVTLGPFAGTLTSLNVQITCSGVSVIYVDAIQLEKQEYATSYFDGDHDGCVWIGERRNSRSQRDGWAATGGREYDLDDLGWYVNTAPGLGMANITLDTQPQANIPGEFLSGYRVDSRIVQIESTLKGTSLANLHAVRKAIIDKIRPDRNPGPRTFQLKYSGGSEPLYLDIVYDSGLEFGEYTTEMGFNEEPAIRFFAPDPTWYTEKTQVNFGVVGSAEGLPSHNTVATTNYTLRHHRPAGVQGTWAAMGTGFSGIVSPVVNAIVRGPDNRIYYAGNFGAAGGVANTRGIAVWNAETESWESWDGDIDGPSGFGIDIAFGQYDTAYVGGSFTAMQGVANTANLAAWNGSTWVSITGSGSANGEVRSCVVDKEGNLYVSGNFTTINGVAANRIAKYDGSTWTALGTGLNGLAYDMAISPAGNLYVAGSFTTANGVTVNRIAKWNGTTFEALEDGASSGIVYTIHFAQDGTLYAGGSFADMGSVTTNAIARWNGQRWNEVGGGFQTSDVVYDITENPDGDIIISGNFTGFADFTKTLSSPIALWNGSSWVHLDLTVPGSGSSLVIDSVLWVDNDRRYLGYRGSGTANIANGKTITNDGSASAYPVIIIKDTTAANPTVKWIENQRTGARLYLDHLLLPAEELTIDLRPGKRSVTSSYRGVVWESIETASDIEDFVLEPGDNIVTNFIDGLVTITYMTYVTWQERYWSADV